MAMVVAFYNSEINMIISCHVDQAVNVKNKKRSGLYDWLELLVGLKTASFYNSFTAGFN